jgi:small subunit ribosomal protein S17e
MGRIKSTMVKKAARQLLDKEPFSEDFEHNKKILGSLLPSKSIRNKVAGYISRLIIMQKAGPRLKKTAITETPQFEYPQQ